MKKDNIELPPLPDNDAIEKVVYARTRVFIPLATYDAIRHMMQEYSIEAIKADRQQRGDPEGWRLVPKELIDFLDAKEHHLPVEDRHVLSIMLAAAPKFGEEE